MTPYRITVFLDNGTAQVTEETFDVAALEEEHGVVGNEAVVDELVARIEDRDDQWKTIGFLTLNFRHINGFRVEAISPARR